MIDDPTPRPPRPMLLELDEAMQADPGLAPPVPDAISDALSGGRAMQTAARLATARGSGFGSLALWVFSTLFTFILTLAAWDYVTGLFSRNTVLGWTAFVLLILAVLIALIAAAKEWAAFARLARLDTLRDSVDAARLSADLRGARGVVADLTRLYAARADTAWGRTRLAERQGDVLDADALLSLAETELMAPLDRAARAQVEAAARQVATVTALVPMALADVATALYANLRMIRRIAEIYGGKSGSFGSWRLLRRVFGHLIATGAVALTDDLIGSVAGGGILSKLSRRFGEGVVNGALTARVGVAAIEICRPMPFVAEQRPRVSELVSRALKGLFNRGDGQA